MPFDWLAGLLRSCTDYSLALSILLIGGWIIHGVQPKVVAAALGDTAQLSRQGRQRGADRSSRLSFA
jgi:hypothetical protein